MKFPMLQKALGLLLILAAFAGCTPEEVKTNTELITASTWAFEQVTSSTLSTDDLAFYTAILSDTRVKYNTDGTYDVSFVDNVFDPYSGTWAFQAEEAQIVQDAGTDDESLLGVVELSELMFTYSFTDSIGTHNISWVPNE